MLNWNLDFGKNIISFQSPEAFELKEEYIERDYLQTWAFFIFFYVLNSNCYSEEKPFSLELSRGQSLLFSQSKPMIISFCGF